MSNPELTRQRRKSTRLAEYDYSTPGSYFVTLPTYQGRNYFGGIQSGKVLLNNAGEMIVGWWQKIPDKFHNIQLDEYILMPNHLHGIINILELEKPAEHVGADPCVRPEGMLGNKSQGASSLPDIIKWFKAMSTNEYIRGVKQGKWEQFEKHLWQRSYYEHVIRKLENVSEVREYILNNPLRWEVKAKVK